MKVGIIVFPGSGCEMDSVHPIAEFYGAENVEYVWYQDEDLLPYDLIVLPGGFSYGDYLRPGAIAKQAPIMQSLTCAVEVGRYVLGISNGFQILLEAGLLPGALLINQGIDYICADANVRVENNQMAFTKQYQAGEQLRLPIAHGHGNYFCEADELAELAENQQIILRYTDSNPNGSLDGIAAITNQAGNVLGIMPQIDRALDKQTGSDAGGRLFESILETWRAKQ